MFTFKVSSKKRLPNLWEDPLQGVIRYVIARESTVYVGPK
jgi:hypothetical protein